MHRNETEMIKSAAIGVAAGAALGAVGAYMATQNPRQVKKVVRKISNGAHKAMVNAEKMMHS